MEQQQQDQEFIQEIERQEDVIQKGQQCHAIVDQLMDTYKDNTYLLNRMYTIIQNLPVALINDANNYEKRQNLNSHISEEQQIFIQVFLSKHNYFYLVNKNCYYMYNGIDYTIVQEDTIIHQLLSSLSENKTLLQWKYKTKISVMKQIKERNLFSSIPESTTIQQVLSALHPSFFPSKNDAKYFLTIIGDSLLKKNNNTELIYIINSKTKQLVDELEHVSALCIGINNLSNKMITKYHERHQFGNCRLIRTTGSIEYWRELLKKIGLNLLCVAGHYSTRYTCSEQFINQTLDEDLLRHVFALKNTTPSCLVETFQSEFIEKTNSNFRVEWKNMHFLWKQFLFKHTLPSVIYSNVLKQMLKDKYTDSYDEETDSFKGITSKYLPVYNDFIQFWTTTMTMTMTETTSQELEIDEINQLFKMWSSSKNVLNEEVIIKILNHFFDISVVENKFVYHVLSSQWDKCNDIEQSLEFIKTQVDNSNFKSQLIHFDDLYQYYHTYCIQQGFLLIVNKCYFEKYLHVKYTNDICYDKFIQVSVFN